MAPTIGAVGFLVIISTNFIACRHQGDLNLNNLFKKQQHGNSPLVLLLEGAKHGDKLGLVSDSLELDQPNHYLNELLAGYKKLSNRRPKYHHESRYDREDNRYNQHHDLDLKDDRYLNRYKYRDHTHNRQKQRHADRYPLYRQEDDRQQRDEDRHQRHENRQQKHEDRHQDRHQDRRQDRHQDRQQDRYLGSHQSRQQERQQGRQQDRPQYRYEDRQQERYLDRHQHRQNRQKSTQQDRYQDRQKDRKQQRYQNRHQDWYEDRPQYKQQSRFQDKYQDRQERYQNRHQKKYRQEERQKEDRHHDRYEQRYREQDNEYRVRDFEDRYEENQKYPLLKSLLRNDNLCNGMQDECEEDKQDSCGLDEDEFADTRESENNYAEGSTKGELLITEKPGLGRCAGCKYE